MRAALVAAMVVLLAGAAGCGTTRTHAAHPRRPRVAARIGAVGSTQRGYATWYGGGLDGGPTASGERFDKRKLTAAHRTLPMNTKVKVTHARTGRSVIVRINDRGPYGKRSRIIDLSEAAARRIGIIDEGVAPVVIEVIGR